MVRVVARTFQPCGTPSRTENGTSFSRSCPFFKRLSNATTRDHSPIRHSLVRSNFHHPKDPTRHSRDAVPIPSTHQQHSHHPTNGDDDTYDASGQPGLAWWCKSTRPTVLLDFSLALTPSSLPCWLPSIPGTEELNYTSFRCRVVQRRPMRLRTGSRSR